MRGTRCSRCCAVQPTRASARAPDLYPTHPIDFLSRGPRDPDDSPCPPGHTRARRAAPADRRGGAPARARARRAPSAGRARARRGPGRAAGAGGARRRGRHRARVLRDPHRARRRRLQPRSDPPRALRLHRSRPAHARAGPQPLAGGGRRRGAGRQCDHRARGSARRRLRRARDDADARRRRMDRQRDEVLLDRQPVLRPHLGLGRDARRHPGERRRAGRPRGRDARGRLGRLRPAADRHGNDALPRRARDGR